MVLERPFSVIFRSFGVPAFGTSSELTLYDRTSAVFPSLDLSTARDQSPRRIPCFRQRFQQPNNPYGVVWVLMLE